MDKSAIYWNKIAKRYAKKAIADETTYQKKLELTRKYFKSDLRVLEIGCGTGSTAIKHSPYVKQIIAVDFSSEMIRIAKEKAGAQNITNINFVCCETDEIKNNYGNFQVILALNVLHLLKNWEEVIKKMYELLDNDGVFISTTPCLGDMSKTWSYILPIVITVGKTLGFVPHVTSFSKNDLKQSLKKAAFQIEYKWQPDLPSKSNEVFIVARKKSGNHEK